MQRGREMKVSSVGFVVGEQIVQTGSQRVQAKNIGAVRVLYELIS